MARALPRHLAVTSHPAPLIDPLTPSGNDPPGNERKQTPSGYETPDSQPTLASANTAISPGKLRDGENWVSLGSSRGGSRVTKGVDDGSYIPSKFRAGGVGLTPLMTATLCYNRGGFGFEQRVCLHRLVGRQIARTLSCDPFWRGPLRRFSIASCPPRRQ